MKERIFYILLAIVLFACSNSVKKDMQNIKQLEEKFYNVSSNAVPNPIDAKNLLREYSKFVNDHPEDENTPEFLFKASRVAIGVQQYEQAIKFLDDICTNHPDSKRVASAIFTKAFVYENNLNDTKTAEKLYKEFIDKYPKDELAESATFALKNLGKTNEELIKEFEEKAANSKQ